MSSKEVEALLTEKTADGKPIANTWMKPHDVLEAKPLTSYFSDESEGTILEGFLSKLPDVHPVRDIVSEGAVFKLAMLLKRASVSSGQELLNWLEKCLDTGGRAMSHATFKELYELTHIEFTALTTDITSGLSLCLNHHTTPDCPVVYAVRMSMSLPFLWDPVVWQDSWGTYRGENISNHLMIDGGVLYNFPLLLISSSDDLVQLSMGKCELNPRLVGFLLDESQSFTTEAVVKRKGLLDKIREHSPLISLLMMITDSLLNHTNNFMTKAHKDKIVFLPVKEMDTTEFDVSEKKLRELIDAAFKATETFFDAKC